MRLTLVFLCITFSFSALLTHMSMCLSHNGVGVSLTFQLGLTYLSHNQVAGCSHLIVAVLNQLGLSWAAQLGKGHLHVLVN